MLNVRKVNGEAPGSVNPSGAVRDGAGGWGPGQPFSPTSRPRGSHLSVGEPHQGSAFPRSKDRWMSWWRKLQPRDLSCGRSDITEVVTHAAQLQPCGCVLGGTHHHPEHSYVPMVQRTDLTGNYENFFKN